jgi:hypothetical protein
MKRSALLLLCACVVGSAAGAGGKAGVKGAKSGAVLSAAPSAAPAATAAGHGGGSSVVLGTGVVAGAVYTAPRYVPPMDPQRDVTEQDCTKPVDLTRGNLKCK